MKDASGDWHHYIVVKAAWLYFIRGRSQSEIAKTLKISQPSVARLIAEAQRDRIVHVSINKRPSECIELEVELSDVFGLGNCIVVPVDASASHRFEDVLPPVSKIAAAYLASVLSDEAIKRVGIGLGRTLAASFAEMASVERPNLEAVSITGSLTRSLAANRMDPIQLLTRKIRGDVYFLPVPYLASSVEEKSVFLSQPSVQQLMEKARASDLFVVGIGSLGREDHLFANQVITEAEYDELVRTDAVGDLMGRFFNIDGQLSELELGDKAVGISPIEVSGRRVIAVVCGETKTEATLGVLRSGHVNELIIDEHLARQVLVGNRG
ncbi:sugar-binding transcriptional regulator [Sinorhizobium sp. K101]|uniref:sugar-binding transcriptional regulator n=1 Tax=unclassified Sinorhizobium TaxID=2613772 RepID=UPI0023D7D86B|nr:MULTISPECIES: sugar-binding domain-containing protein [unclassified Sinorhizobium]WEJ10695.1 sugar-binding transcriptional regulator [Sinorhizobium sp. M103]WEJ14727.1 sugar-binding transcriptional regulator [Sinorhizobium sp. K101]